MKTERVTLLTSPEFKAFLTLEARREGVSVGELVRTRCERRPTDEEMMLAALTAELKIAVAAASKSLKNGLSEAQTVLTELQAKRSGEVVVPKKMVAATRKRQIAGGPA